MKYLQDLQRSFTLKLSRFFFRGGDKRHLQEQIDVHRLFLFTSLHEQRQLGGQLPDDFTQQLIEQAKALPFVEQRSIVHQQLQGQLTSIANCIHSCLTEARDPRLSATALELAWQRMRSSHGSAHGSTGSIAAAAAADEAAAAAGASGPLLSQQQLSQLVQQKLGYSLSVQPSLVAHQEAGLGLFVEGNVQPGALLALFPGLVYNKAVYRRMPGYPRIDVGNPYLTARYDGGVVDSLPWGRGWLVEYEQQQQHQQAAPITAGPRQGLIGRMVAASDGSRRPIPTTAWVHATTAEAANLELLEGRHPLALAHFANHPPGGASPNAVIASFSFKLQGQDDSGSGSSGSSSSRSSSQAEPWVRAYVPNIDYCDECSREHLLTHEVSCVGLVAVQPLSPGSEVLFNYRLSPALLGRPEWYVPVDREEEDNRWA